MLINLLVNITKLRENLVYRFNRLIIGILIVLILSIAYIFKLDLALFLTLISLIFFEIYKSIIRNKFIIISLLFLFIFQTFIFYFIINNYIFLLIITFVYLFCSILFKKNLNILFILFLISVISIIPFLFSIDRNIIYMIVLISFINDTVAFIIGSYIKGPLISPKISPKKTWSGTTFSFLITTILLIFFDYNLLISVIMAISLFYGDFYFSYIKRNIGLKDFSNLLSSHGGLLDRFDSISFLILIFGILYI